MIFGSHGAPWRTLPPTSAFPFITASSTSSRFYETICNFVQRYTATLSLSLSSSLSLLFSLSSLPFIFMTREFIPALVACDEEVWRRRRIEREVEIYIGPYLSTFSISSTLEFIPSVRRTTEECDRISPRCEIWEKSLFSALQRECKKRCDKKRNDKIKRQISVHHFYEIELIRKLIIKLVIK
jgi:hypothetical protein